MSLKQKGHNPEDAVYRVGTIGSRHSGSMVVGALSLILLIQTRGCSGHCTQWTQ